MSGATSGDDASGPGYRSAHPGYARSYGPNDVRRSEKLKSEGRETGQRVGRVSVSVTRQAWPVDFD